jgi:hypothetical protein
VLLAVRAVMAPACPPVVVCPRGLGTAHRSNRNESRGLMAVPGGPAGVPGGLFQIQGCGTTG